MVEERERGEMRVCEGVGRGGARSEAETSCGRTREGDLGSTAERGGRGTPTGMAADMARASV